MVRILAENQEVRERRNQLRHPNYPVPELFATRPNQLWSCEARGEPHGGASELAPILAASARTARCRADPGTK
jgi:hypothetical protein